MSGIEIDGDKGGYVQIEDERIEMIAIDTPYVEVLF